MTTACLKGTYSLVDTVISITSILMGTTLRCPIKKSPLHIFMSLERHGCKLQLQLLMAAYVMCKVINKMFWIHFSGEILCFHLKVEGLTKVCFMCVL